MFARFRLPLLLVVLALCYGTFGYWLIENQSPLDAFYTTVLTLSTVGSGPELGVGGKLFTVSLILFGVATLFAAIGVATEVLSSGELARWLRRKRMSRRTGQLRGHYVVCGYGRVGRTVTGELGRHQRQVLVIESKPELHLLLEEQGIPYVTGDAADETVLRQAGIERADGLVCAVDSDSGNVFIALTARAMNPGLRIVARAAEQRSVDKLRRAGADEVISPYGLSGRRMALLALQPSVLEVLDLLDLGADIRLEEVAVQPGTPLHAMTVAEAQTRFAGVAILAVRQPGGELTTSPDQNLRLGTGDLVIALGPVTILEGMTN
ncbi:TrkA family potassium uptake protein [Streptacidiphilus sp. P02-A3a]|uniref:potassium channel family protein n=1 Tax=Streptacidiphilus sp. P02-A3a TaxID=2704468 RepID=UPI0015F78F66|nr:potassium channel family protein [Streptacidiphilus sp. P02-A3a]QMU71273.1 potassium channel protein [Streptacidiphilus sp. P02-A3a]